MAGATAITPVIWGVVTVYLKIFIDPQKDFRARIDLKKKELLDRLAMQHLTVLKQCLNIEENTFARGDGYNEPDLIGDYKDRVFKLFTIFHRLEVLKLAVKAAYWLLFALISLGFLAFLVNLVFDEARAIVFWCGVVAVLMELGVAAGVHAASQRLGQYEDIT